MSATLALSLESILLEQLTELVSKTPFQQGNAALRHAMLEDILSLNEAIELAYAVDKKGVQNVANAVSKNTRVVYAGNGLGADRSGRAWFFVPTKLKRPFVSKKLISIATNKLCVTVSVPLFNSQGDFIGVVGADIAVTE